MALLAVWGLGDTMWNGAIAWTTSIIRSWEIFGLARPEKERHIPLTLYIQIIVETKSILSFG